MVTESTSTKPDMLKANPYDVIIDFSQILDTEGKKGSYWSISLKNRIDQQRIRGCVFGNERFHYKKEIGEGSGD